MHIGIPLRTVEDLGSRAQETAGIYTKIDFISIEV